MVGSRRLNVRVAGFCELLARSILAALMLVLVLVMARAVATLALSLADLRVGMNALLKDQLVGSLTVLSLLEVYRTVQTYFTAGRVKVTYVLETALVGMVTELVALWFRGTDGPTLLALLAVVLGLLVARILAIRFSPDAGPARRPGWLARRVAGRDGRSVPKPTGDRYPVAARR